MTTYLKNFIKNKNKCRYGITFARTLLTCTEERFPDCGTESIENSAANFLSPHYKGIHLTLFNRFDSTKDTLTKVCNERNLDGNQNIPIENEIVANTDLSPTSRLRQKLLAKSVSPNNESQLSKEFYTYENLPVCPSSMNVLAWWKQHQEMLPVLSKLARLYLAIPASSTKSERLFSASGRVCSSTRTNLEPGKVEAVVVINKNKKLLENYKKVHNF